MVSIMEESTTTPTTPPTTPTVEGGEAAARESSGKAIYEALISDLEYNYDTLQKSHIELQEVSMKQQAAINSLTKQISEWQERASCSQSEKEECVMELERERSQRLAMAQQSKLDRERLDRATAEADSLREELRRLADANTHLSTNLNEMETEAKMATSSQVPLRFRLERAEKETNAVSAHAKWLEAELVAKIEELETVKRSLSGQLSLQRIKATSAALEEAECREKIQLMEREKWQDRLSQQQETLLRQQSEHSHAIQKLEESLLAEQHLNNLHQGNQEQYKQRIASLEHSLQTMEQMARAAEEQQQSIENKILQESEAAIQEIYETKNNEISMLQQQVEKLQHEKETLEQELEAAEQRHLRRRRSGQPALVIEGGGTAAAAAGLQNNTNMPYSLTDLMDRLMEKEDQLSEEIAERHRAELILKKTQLEIEARTPVIKAQRHEFELAVRGHQQAQARLEDALVEIQREKQRSDEAVSSQTFLQNEVTWLKRENHDLARQIQSLLRSRMEESYCSQMGGVDHDLIVEFESVEELQQQNQNLVREHRRLTDKVNELERQLDESILKKSLEVAKEELDLLREERNRQKVLVAGIVQQRDMYRHLCGDKSSSDQANRLSLLSDNESSSSPTEETDAAKDSSAVTQNQQQQQQHQEEIFKLQGDLVHTRNENKALQEQVSRLDTYASNLASSLNKIQGELLTSNSSCARSEAEVEFLKQQCSRLKVSLEDARAETFNIQKVRMELQSINAELERSLTQARGDASKSEQEAVRLNAQRRLLEAQLENAHQSEKRLLAEADSLRVELGRQGALLESVHRIESSLLARTTENQQHRNEEIERERKVTAQEALKQAAELERMQRISEDLEEKKVDAEQARDKALKELLEAKQSAVDASQKLLEAQTNENGLKEKFQGLENALASTKARLEAISSSSTNQAKDKTIEHLSNELETVRADLVTAKERQMMYQKIARDNEASLRELTDSSDQYKEMISSEHDKLKKELEVSSKAAEAKQAALDELGEELTIQRGIQETAGKELTNRIETLTRELEAATKDSEVTSTRLTTVLEEIELHKANALAARNNYERELALHSEARSELRMVRSDLANEISLRKVIESRFEAMLPECQDERAIFEEQRLILEQQLREVEARLKEARDQNELFHGQVTTLAESVERLRSEKVEALGMANDVTVGAQGSSQNPEGVDVEVIQLRQTVSDQRELISSMRSERELLDAQANSLKQSIERERASSAVVRRSLDEARNEVRILREAPPDVGKDDELKDLKLKLKRSEEQIILLRDSNILLREESDKLKASLSVCEKALADAQNAVEPTLQKIRDLEVANVSLEAEKTSMGREVDAWKGRVQSLVARFHPIDPEEHSKAITRAEKSEKECETLKSLKAKAEQETAALRAVVARLNKDISHHKESLDSANRMLHDLKSEKEAFARSVSEAQSLIANERDKFKDLAEAREKQMSSLETDVALKTSRLENLTSILRRQKQILADSQKTQAALQKRVKDQEEVIKQHADVTTKNTEQATVDRVAESSSLSAAIKEAEPAIAKQADLVDSTAPSVETVTVPDGGFRFAASKDTVIPSQEKEERTASNIEDANELTKETFTETPPAGSESHSLPDSKPILMEAVDIHKDPVGLPDTSSKSELLQQEKDSQQDDGASDVTLQQQLAVTAKQEALGTLRDKLMKKKRALQAAMAASKGKSETSPTSDATQPAQPTNPSQQEVSEAPVTATAEGGVTLEKSDQDVAGVAVAGDPEPNAEHTTKIEQPSAALFGSKSTEEFQAAPFSFGSSSSITLPIPSMLPVSPSPFGAFSSGTFGSAPASNAMFGASGVTVTAAPLFGETRKRQQPDHSEPEGEESAVTKQARIDVEATADEPETSSSLAVDI